MEMENRRDKLNSTFRHALVERFGLRGGAEEQDRARYKRLAQCSFLLAVLIAVVVVGGLAWWLSTPGGVVEDQGVKCAGSEVWGDPGECSRYWVCEGGVAVLRTCPKHNHFDVKTLSCTWIHLARCHTHDTSSETDETSGGGVAGSPSLQQLIDKEVRLTSSPSISRLRSALATLPTWEVEQTKAGRAGNAHNVRTVEAVLKPTDWDYLFPLRDPAYTYDNFLKAVAKFPAVCSGGERACRALLTTMFAHFAQETGRHDPGSVTPQWRQGLAHNEELGYSETSRGGAYSSNCDTGQWTAKAWPCGKDGGGNFYSYHGRGAKQLSYNYNYGQFSQSMYGSSRPLLDTPHLVADSWLNLASALWFFSTPQPPKPSMLAVMEGDWSPNKHDKARGLRVGFGLTTNIINGGIECGKGIETEQSKNRIAYYKQFAVYMNVPVEGELGCAKMGKFGEKGAAAVDLYWEQDWAVKFQCKLVTYVTPYSALVTGDYVNCVRDKFNLDI